MKFEWQTIEATTANKNITLRAKVIGGWLIKHRVLTALIDSNINAKKGEGVKSTLKTSSLAICFIPDPNHEWQITKDA
jgi:hypothetical protein